MAHEKFSALKNLLAVSFIDPWRDRKRAKIMLAGTLGSFAAYMLGMALNYGIAGEGFKVTISFQIARLALLGFLGIPFSYWCLACRFPRLVLFLSQFAGLVFFMIDPHSAVTNALGFFLVSSPFWAIYAFRFAVQQSRENHGHETALSSFVFLISGSAGTYMGGWLLHTDRFLLSLFICALLFIVASQLLFVRLPHAPSWRDVWPTMRRRKASTRISFFNGILSTVQDVCIPIWLRAIGQSPLSSGIMLALQPILGFLITPIVGSLVQKGSLRSVRWGGVIIMLGWLMLAAAIDLPWLFLPAFALLASGQNLISVAEVNRWYKMRSPVGILAREGALAFGRCPTFAVTLPVIFLIPAVYPVAGIATALLFIFGVRSRKGKKAFAARRIA